MKVFNTKLNLFIVKTKPGNTLPFFLFYIIIPCVSITVSFNDEHASIFDNLGKYFLAYSAVYLWLIFNLIGLGQWHLYFMKEAFSKKINPAKEISNWYATSKYGFLFWDLPIFFLIWLSKIIHQVVFLKYDVHLPTFYYLIFLFVLPIFFIGLAVIRLLLTEVTQNYKW